MKILFILLFLVCSAFAGDGGNEGGGGGDPVAAKFASLATYVSDYLNGHPQVNPLVSRSAIHQLSQDIANSLHVTSKVGKIEVVDAVSTNPASPLFLITRKTPVYIQISRPSWMKLTPQQLLKAVTDLMISMSAEDQDNEIPLPENPVDSYVFAYNMCAQWTNLVKTTFKLHIDTFNKCTGENAGRMKPVLANIDQQIRSNVLKCKQNCVFHNQTMNGVEICEDYLEQHQQNLSDYKKFAENCG
jgi:hypothetical protein